MKKFLLISALMATAVAATAESTLIGVDGKTSQYGNPINPEYSYSGAQCLYTNAELNKLYSVAADGTVTTAEISAVTFYIYVNTAYDVNFNVTAYAQNVDATAFALDENDKPVMFDYSSAVQGSTTITYENAVDNGELGEEWPEVAYSSGLAPVTITFPEPIKYEGKSLVFTFVCESTVTDNVYFSVDVQYFPGWCPGSDTRSLIYQDMNVAMTTTWTQKDKFLPNLTLDYTTVTEQSTTQVATIGDVAVSVSQVECSPKLSLSSEANVLEFAFDINDPANSGSYDVTLNSVNLGTVNGTAVKISFINPNPAQDYVIGITPKADGVIGTTATVTKQQIAALFPTPAVEVTDWRLLADYNATDTKANVSAAFACTVSGIDGFAAKYSNSDWCDDLSYGNVGLWGDQAYQNDIPDYLAALQPATEANYNALKANDYQFAIAKLDMFQAGVTEAVLGPISKRIWFKSTISLPVAYLTTPSLEAVPSSINGNSYKAYEFSTTVNVSATLTSDEDHLQTNVTFPEALEIRVDETNARIVVYAPAAATLWYRIVPITAAADTPAPLLMAEPAWQQAATNPWSIGKADLTADAIIELKTLDDADNVLEQTSMVIKQSGGVASAATIEADSAATVRYFTPMGVEITPEALTPGSLYIRCTATKAEKIIVR